MKSDRVIESAIRAAQNLLWQNLPPTHNLPDAAAVARLRDLVRSPAVKTVLLHSNDTFLAFVLRAVEFVLADQLRADREIIDHLWDVLDDPHLNKALGLPQNSRMTFRRSLCVPKTSSVLIAGPNRLNVSGDGRAALLLPDPVRLAIQVEEPT
jgi:hypothetical protein